MCELESCATNPDPEPVSTDPDLEPPKLRIRCRVTRPGWLFLGGCLLLYGASLTSQSSLLLILDGIILGCLVTNFSMARRTVGRLRVEGPETDTVPEGGKGEQSWRLHNDSRSAIGTLTVRLANQPIPLLTLAALPPGGSVSQIPRHGAVRRGVYPHKSLEIASAHPFGLVEARRPLPHAGELVIVPAVFPAESPPATGFEPMVGGKFRGRRRTGSGADFAGIRPFTPGDPLRQIHWKSSSKGQGLMVKTFEEELSGRVALFLDGTGNPDADRYDNGVRAAGSLIFAALDAGHHVEWMALPQNRTPLLIPPFTDGSQILRQLAEVTPDRALLTEGLLDQAADAVSKKSAISLVLTTLSDPVLRWSRQLAEQHRPVAIYLPEDRLDQAESLTHGSVWAYSATTIRRIR